MDTDTPGGLNVTPGQILAVLTMVITELVNDAVIDGHTAKLITGLAGILIPFAWLIADAIIHHGHSKERAAQHLAQAGTPVALTKRV